MRLLLDTHIIVAFVGGTLRDFGLEIARQVQGGEHSLFVSVASLWEIAIKSRLGKMTLATSLDELPDLLNAIGVTTLPVLAAHALAPIEPVPVTRDPFDRLLLAVCDVENMRLVTVDRALVGHPLAAKL